VLDDGQLRATDLALVGAAIDEPVTPCPHNVGTETNSASAACSRQLSHFLLGSVELNFNWGSDRAGLGKLDPIHSHGSDDWYMRYQA